MGNLSAGLARHLFTILMGNPSTGLARHLFTSLVGNLSAGLARHLFTRLLWHTPAFLLGHLDTDLVGDPLTGFFGLFPASFLRHLVADLLRLIMALLHLPASLLRFLPTPLLWHITAFLEGMVQRTLSIARLGSSVVLL